MTIQPWLLHQGCWVDPHRSLFLAARLLQREINRLMIALSEDRLVPILPALIGQLRCFGGRLTPRKGRPGTDQLLEEGLDWPITVFTSCLWEELMDPCQSVAKRSALDLSTEKIPKIAILHRCM